MTQSNESQNVMDTPPPETPGRHLHPPVPDQSVIEQDLWTGRTSWKHFSDMILIVAAWTGVAWLISTNAPQWLLWIIWRLTALGWAYLLGRIAYAKIHDRYRLTTQRLFIERGILGKTIDQTELIRVDDVRIQKSLWDRLLGLGTIQIISSDASDKNTCLVGICRPEHVADLVRQNTQILRRKTLFVENV